MADCGSGGTGGFAGNSGDGTGGSAEMSLTSLSRVLRSGRPIQVLVLSPGLYVEELSGLTPDLGYLAMAHREAVVIQSSMAEVSNMLQGLREASRTLRPAVTVVSVPDPSESEPAAWLAGSVSVLSRTVPIFCYDPDRAPRQERFKLFEPAAEFATLTVARSREPEMTAYGAVSKTR